MIICSNVNKVFYKKNNFFSQKNNSNVKVLSNVDFKIVKPGINYLLGPNGAGKTTLLKLLSGIIAPTDGSIIINNNIPFERQKSFLRDITFVFHGKNKIDYGRVRDAFLLAKDFYDIKESDYKETIQFILREIDGFALMDKKAKDLSFGEKMIMEIAISLIHRPKYIYFDEPFIGMDLFNKKKIFLLIRKFQKKYNSFFLITTHQIKDIDFRPLDKIFILKKGELIFNDKFLKLNLINSNEKIVSILLKSKKNLSSMNSVFFTKVLLEYPRLVIHVESTKIKEGMDLICKLDYGDISIQNVELEEKIRFILNG